MDFTRNDAQKRYEGKGIGSKTVAFALKDLEESNLKLVPLCPFVALYLKRHPEWLRLVMDGINIQ